ncbi:unnamed protein product [Rodentolepis nana]|uniref:DEP domain-containing protein n=1 Tax=Rodentolepis nana TaxID=102285 RepID=A0A0R3T921_RODNA|nr:unnamed protein product [Rodentolepis nana]
MFTFGFLKLRDGSSIGISGPQRACGFCASNHEMSTSGKAEDTDDEDSVDPKQSNQDDPVHMSGTFVATSDYSFSSFHSESENQPQRQHQSTDRAFCSCHPCHDFPRQSIKNFFPTVNNNLSTPRKLASFISVDCRHSLPDRQTFFFLWFKLTSSQSLNLANIDDAKSQLNSFFSKNRSYPMRSSGIDDDTSLADQKSDYLETVMVGAEKCSTGQHIIDWLVSNSGGKIDSREKAFALCEAYLKASFLRPLNNRKSPWKFIDGPELYRICEDMDDSSLLPKSTQSMDNLIRRNSLLSESISLSHIDEELSQRDTGRSLSTFALNRPLLENLEINSPQKKEPIVASNFTTLNSKTVYTDYLEKLIQQETRDNCLWGDWKSLIGETVQLLCDVLHLDLRKILAKNLQKLREQQEESPRQHCSLIENKELQDFFRSKYSAMHILRYVHVKKVLDHSESVQILNGLAFTGHLINKHLPTQFFQPRILMLGSSITYERNIYRRTYLGSYAAQEEEYLGNCVTKILSLRPTVILVEGGIANIAMSMLVKSGIAIFCNVKKVDQILGSTNTAIICITITILLYLF